MKKCYQAQHMIISISNCPRAPPASRPKPNADAGAPNDTQDHNSEFIAILPPTNIATTPPRWIHSKLIISTMTSMTERYEHALMREKTHDQYDPMETMDMYKQLANEGYNPAQCNMTITYKACGMDDQCIKVLEKACTQSDAAALAQRGVYYYDHTYHALI